MPVDVTAASDDERRRGVAATTAVDAATSAQLVLPHKYQSATDTASIDTHSRPLAHIHSTQAFN